MRLVTILFQAAEFIFETSLSLPLSRLYSTPYDGGPAFTESSGDAPARNSDCPTDASMLVKAFSGVFLQVTV